jgi:hypothetical protein
VSSVEKRNNYRTGNEDLDKVLNKYSSRIDTVHVGIDTYIWFHKDLSALAVLEVISEIAQLRPTKMVRIPGSLAIRVWWDD